MVVATHPSDEQNISYDITHVCGDVPVSLHKPSDITKPLMDAIVDSV